MPKKPPKCVCTCCYVKQGDSGCIHGTYQRRRRVLDEERVVGVSRGVGLQRVLATHQTTAGKAKREEPKLAIQY